MSQTNSVKNSFSSNHSVWKSYVHFISNAEDNGSKVKPFDTQQTSTFNLLFKQKIENQTLQFFTRYRANI